MALSREALVAQLARYEGWVYSRDSPRYATPLPGIDVPLAPPLHTNCCAFVEGLIVPVAGVPWSPDQHKRSMAIGADRFGPVNVLVNAGLAWPTTKPSPWTVCQGWNGHRGHTFIIADVLQAPGLVDDDPAVLILEANQGFGLNGTGLRSIGPMRGPLPTTWPPLWTMRRLRSMYPELSMAALL